MWTSRQSHKLIVFFLIPDTNSKQPSLAQCHWDFGRDNLIDLDHTRVD
jgi:hypothetical protein